MHKSQRQKKFLAIGCVSIDPTNHKCMCAAALPISHVSFLMQKDSAALTSMKLAAWRPEPEAPSPSPSASPGSPTISQCADFFPNHFPNQMDSYS